MQDCTDTACILRSDPVEFETVTDQDNNPAEIVGNRRRQWLDPRVELLLRQFLGQLINTSLPQTIARTRW